MPLRLLICSLAVMLLAAPLSSGAAGNGKRASQPVVATEEPAPPLTILSIIPAQGEPGTSVTLSGSGFSDKTIAFLGANQVPTTVVGPKQLTFDIPRLQPGLYALFLKREDGITSRAYNFSILPLKPVADSLAPDTTYACAAGSDREVVIGGQNFQPRSQVLFDGAAIASRYGSAETLSFRVPRVAAGLHQVQVRNPEDTVSGALGLFIDARPEVESVSVGDEYVNYYNLNIDGRNFQPDSVVVVTEEKELDQSGLQPTFEVKRLRSGTASATERERIIFVSCTRLVYQRYPYSSTLKNFKVQVVSPGGGESAVVQVSAP